MRVVDRGQSSTASKTFVGAMWSRMLAIFQVGRAKGIAGVVAADSTTCTGIGTHSPAGDSLWGKAAGNTGPAVFAFATSAVA